MDKKILSAAGFFGTTAIIFGAFGAHFLKQHLSTEHLASFETAVRYQMYHALLLLFLGVQNYLSPQNKKTIALLTIIGVMLFSGSIYLLSTSEITKINFKSIGFVTPIGGTLLIAAWLFLTLRFLRKNN